MIPAATLITMKIPIAMNLSIIQGFSIGKDALVIEDVLERRGEG